MHRSGTTISKHLRRHATWDDAALVQNLLRGNEHDLVKMPLHYSLHLLEQAYQNMNARKAAHAMVQDLIATLWHKRKTASTVEAKESLGSTRYLRKSASGATRWALP